MNKVYLIGRLVDAPEVKKTPNDISVTTFRMAVNRRSNRDIADFFNIVTWRGLADTCGKYLQKGQQVAVVGELQTRSYDGKDGVKRYVTEISADEVEFLARSGGASSSQGSYNQGGYNQAPVEAPRNANAFDQQMGQMGAVLVEDDDLPF